MEPDDAPVRDNFDLIINAAWSLAEDHGGDTDQCRALVPRWFWDQELTGQERDQELIGGWLVVEIRHGEPALAEIEFYAPQSQSPEASMIVDLVVPNLTAMAMAVADTGSL